MTMRLASVHMKVTSVGQYLLDSGFRSAGMPKWVAKLQADTGMMQLKFDDDEIARRLGAQLNRWVDIQITEAERQGGDLRSVKADKEQAG